MGKFRLELEISQLRAKIEQKKMGLALEKRSIGKHSIEDDEKQYKIALDQKIRELGDITDKQRKQISSLVQLRRTIEKDLDTEKHKSQQLSMQLSALNYNSPTTSTRTIPEQPNGTGSDQPTRPSGANIMEAEIQRRTTVKESKILVSLQADLFEMKQKREDKAKEEGGKLNRELDLLKIEAMKERNGIEEGQKELDGLKRQLHSTQGERKQSMQLIAGRETQIRQLSKDVVVRNKVRTEKLREQNAELQRRSEEMEKELQDLKEKKSHETRLSSKDGSSLVHGAHPNTAPEWGVIRKQAEEAFSARAAEEGLKVTRAKHKKLENQLEDAKREVDEIQNQINVIETQPQTSRVHSSSVTNKLSKDESNALKLKVL
jgi:hypothetical protein